MKKTLVFVLSAVILFGCVRKRKKDDTVTLRFSAPGFIIYNKIRKKYCEDFMAQNPGVKIIFEPISEQRYFEKLKMQLAAKSEPDIFFMRDFIIDDFIKSQALLDITPYIKKDNKFNVFDIFKILIDSYSYKNKIYGLPASFSVVVIYYNENLFEKYRIKKKEIFTWNDIKRIGKIISKNKKLFGITFEFYDIITLILQNNGEIFNKSGQCKMNNRYSREAFEFLEYLVNKHITPSPGDLSSENAYETFINGKSLMFVGGRWFSTIFKQKIKNFKYNVMPLFRNKKRITRLDSHGWVISSSTRHPEIAYKFLKFITSKDANQQLIEIGDSLPIYKTAVKQNIQKHPDLKIYLNSLKYTYTIRDVISKYMNSIEFNYILYDELHNYLYKAKKIDSALMELCDNINKRINLKK